MEEPVIIRFNIDRPWHTAIKHSITRTTHPSKSLQFVAVQRAAVRHTANWHNTGGEIHVLGVQAELLFRRGPKCVRKRLIYMRPGPS